MDADVVFQVTQWQASDVEYDSPLLTENEENRELYLVKLYGVTSTGDHVSVNVLNFTPFFMVRINHKITSLFLQRFKEYVASRLPMGLKSHFMDAKCLKKKDFWGYQADNEFTFLRLTFISQAAYKAGIRVLQREIQILGVHHHPIRYKLYESNIDPFIRFMHIKNITPTGWISIPAGSYQKNTDTLCTSSSIDISCDWKVVKPVEKDKIAPITIASFDLECTSSHGDFPVARKDYKKTSYELLQAFNESKINEYNIVSELLKCFTDDGDGILSIVYPKSEPNMEFIKGRLLKCREEIINILKGRVVFRKDRYTSVDKATKDEQLKTLTRRLGTWEEDQFTSFLPHLKGDPIIQIGTTVHKYGERECSYKNIITLGTCDPIDGVDVISCATEEEVLMKWQELIVKLDPDIITGYNIFGFDMSYIYERSRELGVSGTFMQLGKITGQPCSYVEKTLSSSALGDNLLKYIDMDGRVLIDIMKVVQRDHKLDSYKLDAVANHFMKMNKHDVSPNDIFRLFKGSSSDRKVIAEYCVQDCALCNQLIMKLEILANNIGMSNVCNVPLSYIFMRGQGVKIFSLVAKQCREDNFMIPTIRKLNDQDETKEDEEGYEGAIVLPPKHGIYLEDPVSVLDYASLYPASMISENLSHDSIVLDAKYDNLPGVEYLDISYDVYDIVDDKKVKVGEKVCRFVQPPNGEKGVIPRILMKLLKARKDTRKRMEYETVVTNEGVEYTGVKEESETHVVLKKVDGSKITISKDTIERRHPTYDEFEKAVLDGLQLAYKVTANSLYGQVGARTSPIYLKDIAACTTATGRNQILKAKKFIEDNYPDAEVVYGDTDSLFVKINPRNEQGEFLKGRAAILPSIRVAQEMSHGFKQYLKAPHDLEYEKTFWPFILFSKKRYCANKYEHDDKKCKMNSMGIALKRRDNAPIVKHIYGGILDIILNKQDIKESITFLKSNLLDLVDGKFPLEQLVITKSLRADYKDPERIAHKVLAERMGERDPGNKPMVNDRIPFVYIQTPSNTKAKVLQGDRIEHPDFIRKQNLKPDYEFYITNQIMKPVLQLYALTLENLEGYNKGPHYFPNMEKKLIVEKQGDVKKAKDRLDDLKEAEVQKILFEPVLVKVRNKRNGLREITDFFAKVI